MRYVFKLHNRYEIVSGREDGKIFFSERLREEPELIEETIGEYENSFFLFFVHFPRIGEKVFFNGRYYAVIDVIHHYHEGFAPYIDIECEEIPDNR